MKAKIFIFISLIITLFFMGVAPIIKFVGWIYNTKITIVGIDNHAFKNLKIKYLTLQNQHEKLVINNLNAKYNSPSKIIRLNIFNEVSASSLQTNDLHLNNPRILINDNGYIIGTKITPLNQYFELTWNHKLKKIQLLPPNKTLIINNTSITQINNIFAIHNFIYKDIHSLLINIIYNPKQNIRIKSQKITIKKVHINNIDININLGNATVLANMQINNLPLVLHGKISQNKLLINSLTLNQWQLNKPAILSLKNLNLNKLCLDFKKQKICLQKNANQYFIKLKQVDLKIINYLIAENLKIIKGRVSGDIQITNSNFKPNLSITDAKLIMPITNQTISSINGSIKYTNKVELNVDGKSKNGNIKISGELDTKTLNGIMKITGNDFDIINSDAISISGKPMINISINKLKKIIANGAIEVNKVNINPSKIQQGLPNNTIIEANTNETSNVDISGTIKLTIPKPIKTKIYGISGNLIGKLALKINNQSDVTANGDLYLKNPTHPMLPSLKIKKAKIFYSHSPISYPYLEIHINRTLSESWQASDPFSIALVKVGVRIYGPIDNPSYNYYSSPIKMSDNQILASLIAGHQTSTIMPYQAALLSIGVNSSDSSLLQAVNPMNNMANFILFDSVQVVSLNNINNPLSTPNNDDTAILLMKNIGKKFKLEYIFSLLDDSFQLSLNAKIEKSLYGQCYINQNSSGINLIKIWN